MLQFIIIYYQKMRHSLTDMCLKLIYTFIFKPYSSGIHRMQCYAHLALLFLYLWTSYESSLSASFSECSHYQVHSF